MISRVSKLTPMRRLTVVFFFVIAAISFFASSAHAQSPTTKPLAPRQNVEQKRLLIQQRRDAIKRQIEVKQATREAKLSELREKNVRLYFNRLMQRLEAHLARLEKLTERIETRLAKMKEEDPSLNTSDIEAQIAEAKVILEETEAEIIAAKANLETVLASEDPKAAFVILKDVIKEIRGQLVKVHVMLTHLIGDIKGLRVGQITTTPKITSTATPTEVPTTPTTLPSNTPTP